MHHIHFLKNDQLDPDRDLVLTDEMHQYYADADHHTSQSSSSLVEIDNFDQATGFLPSDLTSISFKELVQHNTLLESKLKKMIAIVESLQSFSVQPS